MLLCVYEYGYQLRYSILQAPLYDDCSTFSCGMPACVVERGPFHSPKESVACNHTYSKVCICFDALFWQHFRLRRTLWASNVARAGSFSRGCVPPHQAAQDDGNPQFQFSCRFALLLCLSICITPPFRNFALWQSRNNSSRASRPSICANHARCFCVCACCLKS